MLRMDLPGFWPAVCQTEFAAWLRFSDQAPHGEGGTLNALRTPSVGSTGAAGQILAKGFTPKAGTDQKTSRIPVAQPR